MRGIKMYAAFFAAMIQFGCANSNAQSLKSEDVALPPPSKIVTHKGFTVDRTESSSIRSVGDYEYTLCKQPGVTVRGKGLSRVTIKSFVPVSTEYGTSSFEADVEATHPRTGTEEDKVLFKVIPAGSGALRGEFNPPRIDGRKMEIYLRPKWVSKDPLYVRWKFPGNAEWSARCFEKTDGVEFADLY